MKRAFSGIALILLCAIRLAAAPQTPPQNSARITIASTSMPVTIDAKLDEPAWQTAARYETWYETNPGDNIEPKVKTVGWVTYDSKFFYFGIESADPAPQQITAPYADHDFISGDGGNDELDGGLLRSAYGEPPQHAHQLSQETRG